MGLKLIYEFDVAPGQPTHPIAPGGGVGMPVFPSQLPSFGGGPVDPGYGQGRPLPPHAGQPLPGQPGHPTNPIHLPEPPVVVAPPIASTKPGQPGPKVVVLWIPGTGWVAGYIGLDIDNTLPEPPTAQPKR